MIHLILTEGDAIRIRQMLADRARYIAEDFGAYDEDELELAASDQALLERVLKNESWQVFDN